MPPIATRLRDATKRHPALYRRIRAARLALGHRLPPRQLDGVPGRVHRNDLMLTSTADHAVASYARVGREGADLVADAVELASAPEPRAILDLGCGHGRVLRFLRERFPSAVVTACDLDPEAVDFCATELGATPLPGSHDFDDVAFDRYDLVWMGSVVTHLPTERWHQLARTLGRILRPGGLVVFTTHGERALGGLDSYGPGLEARRSEVLDGLADRGHVYLPYAHYGEDSYGVAFHTTDEVDRTMGEALDPGARVLFRPAGWGGHQDAHAFQKG